jgi:hypothetical protein
MTAKKASHKEDYPEPREEEELAGGSPIRQRKHGRGKSGDRTEVTDMASEILFRKSSQAMNSLKNKPLVRKVVAPAVLAVIAAGASLAALKRDKTAKSMARKIKRSAAIKRIAGSSRPRRRHGSSSGGRRQLKRAA